MRVQFHPSNRISTGDAIRCVDRSIAGIFLLGIAGIFVLAGCVPVLCAASLPHPHRQPRQIVLIIEKMERQVQNAELTGNTATLATMLSDDYLGIYSDGTLATKTETLDSLKSGSTHFSDISIFDRKIRVFGSTAVVTSKARVKGVREGENVTGLYRYTRVYHRHNGVWKIVSFEASTVHPHGSHHGAEDGADRGSRPAPAVVPPQS